MEHFEKKNGFIQRQLTDNAHIARIARKYLEATLLRRQKPRVLCERCYDNCRTESIFATLEKEKVYQLKTKKMIIEQMKSGDVTMYCNGAR